MNFLVKVLILTLDSFLRTLEIDSFVSFLDGRRTEFERKELKHLHVSLLLLLLN